MFAKFYAWFGVLFLLVGGGAMALTATALDNALFQVLMWIAALIFVGFGLFLGFLLARHGPPHT